MYALTLALIWVLPTICSAGTIVVDGGRFLFVGGYDEATGELSAGYRFARRVVHTGLLESTHPQGDGSVAILGAPEETMQGEEFAPGNGLYFICLVEGLECTFYDGATAMTNFLDDLNDGSTAPSMIVIPGDGTRVATNENLSIDENNALSVNAPALSQYVLRGGSLYTSTQNYDWLISETNGALAIPLEEQCLGADVTITPLAEIMFPGITRDELDLRNRAIITSSFRTRCEVIFENFEDTVFEPLFLDQQGRPYALFSRNSLQVLETTLVNCSDATDQAGTWTVELADTPGFRVEFDVGSGVTGDEFEDLLVENLNASTDFADANCVVSRPNVLVASCPNTVDLSAATITFLADGAAAGTGVTELFNSEFVINSLSCPVPLCESDCTGAVQEPVCDQDGIEYQSMCQFNFVACRFPSDPIVITPCPPPPASVGDKCTLDSECNEGGSDLVCGAGTCDLDVDGNTIGDSCCVAKCAFHAYDDEPFVYEASCCATDGPCPRNEGGCTDDSQCAGSLVCAADSCDPTLYPEGASCCVEPCADFGDASWTYDQACCTAERPCPIGAGSCESNAACDGDLVCATDGATCGDASFPGGTQCCEVSCRSHDVRGWVYDESCCSNVNTCGANEGGCDADSECGGGLVCGADGSCDPDLFPGDARCCVASCAAHELDLWTFSATCCTDEVKCPANEGGCSADSHCEGDLVCGPPNSCGSEAGFGEDARCCVDKCAAFGLGAFEFDSECCTDDVQCGVSQGPCAADGECAGELVCGGNDACPNDAAFNGQNCCEVSCATHDVNGWVYDATCCDASSPCPVGEGGCQANDDFCADGLVCGSCPDDEGFPTGASCCQVPCTMPEVDGWVYDPDCCDGNDCGIGQGGCDDTPAGSCTEGRCGLPGSCDLAFYDEDARCCVVECANRLDPNWVYDASCCEDNACPAGEGGCVSDDQCRGDTTCGEPGNCPTTTGNTNAFPDDARCCEVLCAAHDIPGWEYDADCCDDEAPCPANEGGCTDDDQCAPGLVCGNDNCDPMFGFDDDARCCVAPCAAHDLGGWSYNATCCTDVAPCPANEGSCATDDQCDGSLVCGGAGSSCDPDLYPGDARCCVSPCANVGSPDFDPTAAECCSEELPCPVGAGTCDPNGSGADCDGDLVCVTDKCDADAGFNPGDACCAVSCAAHETRGWEYDPTCCTDDLPCPAHEGSCSSDAQCEGDLVCGSNNCDPEFFPEGANCCVAECADDAASMNGDAGDDCCSSGVACPIGVGVCTSDAECGGVLTCGDDERCQVSCAKHNVRTWEYDAECCTEERPCPVNEGSCSSDAQCADGLVCGSNNCDPHFFPDGANCCVEPCAALGRDDAFVSDEECCLDNAEGAGCPIGVGLCNTDDQCDGQLVCGTENCDADIFGRDQNCCEVSCASHSIRGWIYDESCCTVDEPCPAHEGSCSSDDECAAGLVCGEDNCDPEFFPEGANCCVEPCADWKEPGWNFFDFAEGECCSGVACPVSAGACDVDAQCDGNLVCGDAGNCPEGFPANVSCCQVSCARPDISHPMHGWEFDASCCSDRFPCAIGVGGCVSDAQCLGTALCGDAGSSCPGALFPVPADGEGVDPDANDGSSARCCVPPPTFATAEPPIDLTAAPSPAPTEESSVAIVGGGLVDRDGLDWWWILLIILALICCCCCCLLLCCFGYRRRKEREESREHRVPSEYDSREERSEVYTAQDPVGLHHQNYDTEYHQYEGTETNLGGAAAYAPTESYHGNEGQQQYATMSYQQRPAAEYNSDNDHNEAEYGHAAGAMFVGGAAVAAAGASAKSSKRSSMISSKRSSHSTAVEMAAPTEPQREYDTLNATVYRGGRRESEISDYTERERDEYPEHDADQTIGEENDGLTEREARNVGKLGDYNFSDNYDGGGLKDANKLGSKLAMWENGEVAQQPKKEDTGVGGVYYEPGVKGAAIDEDEPHTAPYDAEDDDLIDFNDLQTMPRDNAAYAEPLTRETTTLLDSPDNEFDSPDPQHQPQFDSPDPQFDSPDPQFDSPDPAAPQPQFDSPDPQFDSPDPAAPQPQFDSPDPQFDSPDPHDENPRAPLVDDGNADAGAPAMSWSQVALSYASAAATATGSAAGTAAGYVSGAVAGGGADGDEPQVPPAAEAPSKNDEWLDQNGGGENAAAY